MEDYYIHIDYPNGHLNLVLDEFFPCTIKAARIMFPLINRYGAVAEKEKDAAERKALAEEVEAARKTMVDAQNAYQKKLREFVDKYHSYHFTSTDPTDVPVLFDLFDRIFSF